MSIRKTVVAGSFYPDTKNEINEYINQFNKVKDNSETFKNIRAIISPHAGYIFSGFTANLAYKKASENEFKRIVIIGPSHRVYLKGASIALYDEYETPLGNIDMDLDFSNSLKDKFDFLDFNIECEFEHSTETQAPFIKNYFPNSKIVEIVYGDCSYEDIEKLVDEVLKDKDNFVVISTDLSHFHNQEEAKLLDNICIEAIDKMDMNKFEKCEACGKIGVMAIVKYAIKNGLDTKVLHYCTSADVTKDKNRVVGYTSALIGEQE